MARVASSNGTRKMLCTPHRKDVTEGSSIEHIRQLVFDINKSLRRQHLDIELFLGMENHLDPQLPTEITAGRALTINGSRYALVEMPFFGYPSYLKEVLSSLQENGIIPVLAHPERIEAVQRDITLLVDLVERGMLTQITAGSVLGYFGDTASKFTRVLLEQRMVHVIASDCHTPEGPRSPTLLPGINAIINIIGEIETKAMVTEIPKAIMEDKDVLVSPPRTKY